MVSRRQETLLGWMVQFKKKKNSDSECISWSTSSSVAEPSFVFADVIREGPNRVEGDDDKIYFFFTEVSVEYEFFGNLLIPRVARVCKVCSRYSCNTSIIIFNVCPFCRDCSPFQPGAGLNWWSPCQLR